mmetsp:Transcript_113424/g.293708  ORF Transcript_113424/g.293708 Transcript_113424/m.293708 type:complete len:203 (+) Transcript_113424:391-999(+)
MRRRPLPTLWPLREPQRRASHKRSRDIRRDSHLSNWLCRRRPKRRRSSAGPCSSLLPNRQDRLNPRHRYRWRPLCHHLQVRWPVSRPRLVVVSVAVAHPALQLRPRQTWLPRRLPRPAWALGVCLQQQRRPPLQQWRHHQQRLHGCHPQWRLPPPQLPLLPLQRPDIWVLHRPAVRLHLPHPRQLHVVLLRLHRPLPAHQCR